MSYKWKLEEIEAINRRRSQGEHGDVATLLKPEVRELDWSRMPKHQAILRDWTTPELLVEGSINCAKTTCTLSKEIDAVLKYPGIPILMSRWTEDALQTKLRPPFEQLLQLRGVESTWDRDQRCYDFPNRSRVYAFGLKAASAIERMNKLRGLGVCRILIDQAEEIDRSVAEELRGRLRPDLTATLSGLHFPFQLTFVNNPNEDSFWLSREFPTDHHIKGRKLYGGISIFDNPYLPQSTIEGLLRTWPEGHPKHVTMVLGLRGLNIVGDAIYEDLYDRTIHTHPLVAGRELLEAYEIGKHNPCWMAAQRTPHGALQLLGGILGFGLALEDFCRLVKQIRNDWFPGASWRTTASPVGEKEHRLGRVTLLDVLREWDVRPIWRDTSNMPDVILTCIEALSAYLRRRTSTGKEESFALNADPDRWLVATREGTTRQPFASFAFEGGYVWEPELVSVAHKRIKRPHEDDHYSNCMRAVENLLLSFFLNQPSEVERTRRQQRQREQELANPFVDLGPNSWLAY